jgi:hypothetical protein
LIIALVKFARARTCYSIGFDASGDTPTVDGLMGRNRIAGALSDPG